MSGALVGVERLLAQGRHVLIGGEVGDVYQSDGAYVPLPTALRSILFRMGFHTVAIFSPADGFRFSDRDSRERFIAARDGVARAPEELEALEAAAALGNDREQHLLPIVDPLPAATAMRAALRGAPEGLAIIVSHAQLWLPAGERRALAVLYEAMTARISDAVQPSRLVLLAPALPAYLSELPQHLPAVSVVDLERPTLRDREDLARRTVEGAFGVGMLDPAARAHHADRLARGMDASRAYDFEAARRESLAERIPISDSPRLLHSFRTGARRGGFHELRREDFVVLEAKLREQIVGQDIAISKTVRHLVRAREGAGRAVSLGQHPPAAKLLLLGPSGTGKTQLLLHLAELVYGSAESVFRIDCGELAEPHAVSRLTGASPGYIGYDQGGQLTERVRRQPMSLILLDEIEKAHADLWKPLLALLSAGRLTDSRGFTVDFRDTIVAMTSNIGSATVPPGVSTAVVHEHFADALRTWATTQTTDAAGRPGGLGRAEVYGRIVDGAVEYDVLRPAVVDGLVRQDYARWAGALARRDGTSFDVDLDSLVELITVRSRSQLPLIGARELQRHFDDLLEGAYAEGRVSGAIPDGAHVGIGLVDGTAQMTAVRHRDVRA